MSEYVYETESYGIKLLDNPEKYQGQDMQWGLFRFASNTCEGTFSAYALALMQLGQYESIESDGYFGEIDLSHIKVQ